MARRPFRIRRIAARITQRDIGRLLGYTPGAVTMFERRTGVKEETVKRYEEALAYLIAERRGKS